jgi:hypothetical protein
MEPVLRVDLRCRGCGYGIVVAGEPPLCPLCRSKDWTLVGTTFPQLPWDDDEDPRARGGAGRLRSRPAPPRRRGGR